MKTAKYIIIGAMMTVISVPTMAQDATSAIEQATKIIKSGAEDKDKQVTAVFKTVKKDAKAIAGIGRAYLNAKEFDEETGLYYYGARYYDPRLSLWMNVDPISNYDPRNNENYLDGEHNNGIYNYANLNPYIYCYQNPVKLVDPNGKQALAGSIMGGLTEYASIVGEKMIFENKTFIDANKDISTKDIASIGFSMVVGCVSGTAKFAKFMSSNMGKRIIKEIGTNIVEGFMNVAVDILMDQRDMSFDDAKSVITQSIINAGLGELLPKPARKNLEEAEKNVRYYKDPKYWKAKEAVNTRNAAKGLENIETVAQGTATNITSKKISKEMNE